MFALLVCFSTVKHIKHLSNILHTNRIQLLTKSSFLQLISVFLVVSAQFTSGMHSKKDPFSITGFQAVFAVVVVVVVAFLLMFLLLFPSSSWVSYNRCALFARLVIGTGCSLCSLCGTLAD